LRRGSTVRGLSSNFGTEGSAASVTAAPARVALLLPATYRRMKASFLPLLVIFAALLTAWSTAFVGRTSTTTRYYSTTSRILSSSRRSWTDATTAAPQHRMMVPVPSEEATDSEPPEQAAPKEVKCPNCNLCDGSGRCVVLHTAL